MNKESVSYFKENKYCHVQNCIDKKFASVATLYSLFASDFMLEKEDNNIDNYGDFLMESMLAHMVPVIKEYTNIDVLPTYSFYKKYDSPHDSEVIIPKQSSEITAVICLGYSYDDIKGVWGLLVDGKKVNINISDMLIFKPHEVKISRPSNNISDDFYEVYAVLNYVDKNGKYKDLVYDQREFLGK